MSVDPSTIKPGGKVSVTMPGGTKVIDALVDADRCILNHYFALSNSYWITSIDAYTPPTPEWDRPEVFAVGVNGVTWVRSLTRAGVWWSKAGDRGITGHTEDLQASAHSPVTVLAVYADGVER